MTLERLLSGAPAGPDPGRILATSTVLVLHAGALLLLLLPLAGPGPAPMPASPRERWSVTLAPPAPPLPPRPLEPVPPVPRAAPGTPAARVAAPSTTTPAQPSPGARVEPADPAPAAAIPGLPPSGGQGLPRQASLAYAYAPPPPYPRQALRTGQQGTVLLRVLVDEQGQPLEVVVERSSGHRALDQPALRQVSQRWRFVPAEADGRPVKAWGLVPVGFSLQQAWVPDRPTG